MVLRGSGLDLARSGEGLARFWAGLWRGLGKVLRGSGLDYGMQKNAKKVQKNAKIFAYMDFFLYLCIGFGNSSNRNHLKI